MGCWNNPLGLTGLAVGGGPLPSALPSPTPRDRQLKSLDSEARWITPGLLGTALHYIGTKNQSLSSDVPIHPSHHDPKNQTAFNLGIPDGEENTLFLENEQFIYNLEPGFSTSALLTC